jgi:hypothetical protein
MTTKFMKIVLILKCLNSLAEHLTEAKIGKIKRKTVTVPRNEPSECEYSR